jgi:hypothetical protein
LSLWTNNRYAFTGGNPITLIELDGHEPVRGVGGVVRVVVRNEVT